MPYRSAHHCRAAAIFVCLAPAVLLAPSTAQATTDTSTMAVTATVVATCALAASPLAFGNYTMSQTDSTTSVTATCTSGTTYTVALSDVYDTNRLPGGVIQAVGNKAAFLWQKFPKFVLGFLLISILATYQFFNKDQVSAIANLSRWAFLLTFAGVGLRTNFSEMRTQGLRPFAVGAIGEVVIAGFTLALVYGAGKVFGW